MTRRQERTGRARHREVEGRHRARGGRPARDGTIISQALAGSARRRCAQSEEAYLPLDRVLAICKEHKIEEEDARLLLRICRRVGDLIHYEHDPALRDIVVLKPDWLATAMSFVLDDKQTRDEPWSGELRAAGRAVERSGPDRRNRVTRPSLHPLFLRLMERFDLSYKWPYRDRVWPGGMGGTRNRRLAYEPDRATGSGRSSRVPGSRVAGAMPADGDEQQVQICRIVEHQEWAIGHGRRAVLPVDRAPAQILAGARGLQPRASTGSAGWCWMTTTTARALLEHIGNDVRITVRCAVSGGVPVPC